MMTDERTERGMQIGPASRCRDRPHVPQRVLLVHNVIAPYRLPLFEALGTHFALRVLFCSGEKGERNWNVQYSPISYSARVLPALQLGHIRVNFRALREFRKFLPDTVLIADNDENVTTSMLLMIACWLCNVRLVVWSEHVTDRREASQTFQDRFKALARGAWRRLVWRRAITVISMSGRMSTEFLVTGGVDRRRIIEGTQVMPAELLIKPDLNSPVQDYPYLLYLGYLRPEKGVDVLLRAFLAFSHEAHLIVAGSGPLEQDLRRQAESSDRIHFAGYVDGVRKANLIANAEALIVPSVHEPWGLVVNEAIYYGTPVLASDAVAASCILRNEDGSAVFRADDESSLRSTLESFLDGMRRIRRQFPTLDVATRTAVSIDVGIEPFLQALHIP